MVLTALGLNVPAATDAFDPQTDFGDLANSLEGRVIVPVANVAARTALVTAVAPSPSEPLYVWRADALPGLQLEATINGTTWQPVTQEAGPGWSQAGWALQPGWTAPGPTGGYRSLAYRQVGPFVRLNGVINKSSAWAANEGMLIMPASLWPTGAFVGVGDYTYDVQNNGVVRIRSAGAGGSIGVDISWLIG